MTKTDAVELRDKLREAGVMPITVKTNWPEPTVLNSAPIGEEYTDEDGWGVGYQSRYGWCLTLVGCETWYWFDDQGHELLSPEWEAPGVPDPYHGGSH
jgi:hypothetical protein